VSLPPILARNLALPVIGAPMFIVSNPELVIAQCTAGIVGSFPALNARPAEELEAWIERIESALAAFREANPGAKVAPYAVNQIVHATNERLRHDLEVCVRRRVPIVITSLRAPDEVVPAVHGYGGLVFHDVVSLRHARKAAAAGVDGLILVCAGAGGHAGPLSPFALVSEVRQFFAGTLILSGAITRGEHVLAALAMGADLAYVGTRFIATDEARAPEAYKRMIVESTAADIVYSNYFTGVHGNYLRGSIAAAGMDPDALPAGDKSAMKFGAGARGGSKPKAWKDIWSAGQGVGSIDAVLPARQVVEELARQYEATRARLSQS
jgi:nitronate monooxygenase